MSEPKMISPMLDRFSMGDPISSHHGVKACPAINNDTDNKYIVKIISFPSTQVQMDALLLAGAYADKSGALGYFKALAEDVLQETALLDKLSGFEGFQSFDASQLVAMDEDAGYDVYLLAPYQKTLSRLLQLEPMTHLMAINLALDVCAALAVCRRSGYLYANLKPENVYLTDSGSFRIGDLGFLKLDGLHRAVLADRYQSKYTAPEIADAFSSPSDNLDIYALGLILYQVYNGGQLPFTGERAPAEVFAPPMYADYEMSEIILKACAPNPADRWQDPMELGQTLVSYMQRNGVNDTPIIPVPEESSVEEPEKTEDDVPASDESIAQESSGEDSSADAQEAVATEESDVESAEEEKPTYVEDDFGNFSFLEFSEDQTAPENTVTEVGYEEVGEDLSDILSVVDDLASHEVPDPVIAPEPVEVAVPEVAAAEEVNETEESQDEDHPTVPSESACSADETIVVPVAEDQAVVTDAPVDASVNQDAEAAEDEEEEDTEDAGNGSNIGKWLRNTVLLLLAVLLVFAGVMFYRHYYLQPIRSIRLEGNENTLTVHVDTDVDEALLTVICADSYGNHSYSPVINGKAVFTDLAPDTGYTVNVNISGFHRLTGEVSDAYSTPVQTNIVQFSASAGAEEGSVLLTFRVDGPDSDGWAVVYSASGVAEKEQTFTGHTVTVSGLVVGKEYTFKLIPAEALYITSGDSINYKVTDLVFAEELTVTKLENGNLSVQWTVAGDVSVESWTVRCNSGTTYDETYTAFGNSYEFTVPEALTGITVEVTASGMSVGTRIYVDLTALQVPAV